MTVCEIPGGSKGSGGYGHSEGVSGGICMLVAGTEVESSQRDDGGDSCGGDGDVEGWKKWQCRDNGLTPS